MAFVHPTVTDHDADRVAPPSLPSFLPRPTCSLWSSQPSFTVSFRGIYHRLPAFSSYTFILSESRPARPISSASPLIHLRAAEKPAAPHSGESSIITDWWPNSSGRRRRRNCGFKAASAPPCTGRSLAPRGRGVIARP